MKARARLSLDGHGHSCRLIGSRKPVLRTGFEKAGSANRILRRYRGELAIRRKLAPQTCIRLIREDRNHDAVMRIGGEAPRRRAHSKPRLEGHVQCRLAATSARHLRLGLDRRANRRISVVLAYRQVIPPPAEGVDLPAPRRWSPAAKVYEELAGERHDHGLASAATGVRGSFPIPLRQRAVLLMQQMTPGELNHPPAYARVACFGESALALFLAALVRGRCQAGISRHRFAIPQVAREDLLRVSTPTPTTRACRWTIASFPGRSFQAFGARRLDFLDLLLVEAKAGHVASQLGQRVRRHSSALRCAQGLELPRRPSQGRPEAANAETGEIGLHSVHDARALLD